jgi:hypothetical protein
MVLHGNYFYGNEISEYGQEHGYLDYRTLVRAFDAVLNNNIMTSTYDIGYWEQESGFVDNSEEIEELRERIEELEENAEEIEELRERIEELEYEQDDFPECYQYYIVSDFGAKILEEIGEIVWYNDQLDMYVWGVTHWGTSWDHVLTNVRCNVPYEEEV